MPPLGSGYPLQSFLWKMFSPIDWNIYQPQKRISTTIPIAASQQIKFCASKKDFSLSEAPLRTLKYFQECQNLRELCVKISASIFNSIGNTSS
ncbi:hypothetical protein DTW91_08740 [Chryseobacterium sp. SC28]|nr:hypothetical protein DTW91_08740 [Chryseobacterium sp. SC28]